MQILNVACIFSRSTAYQKLTVPVFQHCQVLEKSRVKCLSCWRHWSIQRFHDVWKHYALWSSAR